MAWRDRLRKASFRDVPFEIEEDGGKGGRRLQTHEFPQRDKPFTEDLGRAKREFTVRAFVIGADYMEKRDALLAALEAEGAGTLVHPWLGSMQVNAGEYSFSHSLSKGGMCEFTISFVESGELTFPTAAVSPGAQSLLAADAVMDVAAADFLGDFNVAGFPAFVAEGARADLGSMLDRAGAALGGLQQVLANPLDSLLSTFELSNALDLPSSLVAGVRGLFDRAGAVLQVGQSISATIGGAGVHARNRNAVLALAGLGRTFGESVGPVNAPTPSTQQRQVNAAALATLMQRATLVQAAGMASSMVLPVHDDALRVREAVTSALDQASMNASDEAYQALQTLRSRVHADVTARLAGAARLVSYTPRDVLPAVVFAYDRYEDVDREQEIVERNRIRHPGFVPANPLWLLAT